VEDIIRIQRETVDEHIRHENAKNWSGVYDTFVHDETAFYDVVPFNTRFPGFAGVKGFYEAANVAFPDFKIDVWGEYDSPGCSVREVTISGTHKGDWCGLPGTGRHIRFQLAGLFLFHTGDQAGKLLAERIYLITTRSCARYAARWTRPPSQTIRTRNPPRPHPQADRVFAGP
jgi:predicted ester cyclase